MIVARKPWMIYDVDLIGAIIALALAVGGVWFVGMHWQQTWADYRVVAAARNTAQSKLHEDVVKLEQFETGLAEFAQTVDEYEGRVPRGESLSTLLHQMTDVAKGAELEILSVTPQPSTEEGPYVVTDVRVGARGRSHDFIRFLDRLAEVNSCQSLVLCSITRPVSSIEPTCDFAWTMRFYLLPATASGKAGS